MQTYQIILLCLLGLVIIFIIVFSIYFAHYITYPKLVSTKESIKTEKDNHIYFDYDLYEKKEFNTPSYDGYIIKGTFIQNNIPSNKYVIISHGYTYTRYGSLKYVDVFYKLGFNCIIVDDRGCGDNDKYKCTMGVNESKDICYVINNVYKTFGDDIILGLHGESMGASLSLMSLKYKPKVAFVVSDCAYAYLKEVLKDQVKKQVHLPGFLVYISGVFNKLLYGYNFARINVVKDMKDSDVPVCFIHGTLDTFTNCKNSQWLYDNYNGYKELHFVEGADHAKAFITDPDNYRKIVSDFLNKVLK